MFTDAASSLQWLLAFAAAARALGLLRPICRASRRTANQKATCAARFPPDDWWQACHSTPTFCSILLMLCCHIMLTHLLERMPAAQGHSTCTLTTLQPSCRVNDRTAPASASP